MDPGLILRALLDAFYFLVGLGAFVGFFWLLALRARRRREIEREERLRAFLESSTPAIPPVVDWAEFEDLVGEHLRHYGPGEPISEERQLVLLQRAQGVSWRRYRR